MTDTTVDAVAEFMARAKNQSDNPREVWVYVRKGNDDEAREISFRIPDELNPADLLERGYAIDGNSAIGSVYYEPDAGYSGSFVYPDMVGAGLDPTGLAPNLSVALRDAELVLIKFLAEKGYTVSFK